MATFAESLNNFASWVTTTKTATENVKAAINPPKPAPVQTVRVEGPRVSVGQYSFDWRVLAGFAAVIVGLIVVKVVLLRKA